MKRKCKYCGMVGEVGMTFTCDIEKCEFEEIANDE